MSGIRVRGIFEIFSYDRTHKPLSYVRASNMVVDKALDYIRDLLLPDANIIENFYFLPIKANPLIDAGDLIEDHPGWEEFTNYDETERQSWQASAGGTGEISNIGFEATLTISAGTDLARTLGGMALVGGGPHPDEKENADPDTLLFCAAAIDIGDIIYAEGYPLKVRYTLTFIREE